MWLLRTVVTSVVIVLALAECQKWAYRTEGMEGSGDGVLEMTTLAY